MTASRSTTPPEPALATDQAGLPPQAALGTSHSNLPVIVRLHAMQQRARRLLLMHGVALAVLGGAGSLLALFVLDWALWFPSLLRFGFGLAWLVLLAWIISRHIWPPLCSRLSTLHVATKIEERFPEFEDRLTSAVSFISEDFTMQDPLQEKLIERTEHIAHSVPIENAITAIPVWRTTVVGFLPLAALLALAVVGPNWINTGAYRFLLPFAPIYWPRTVEIRPLTEDLLIASGESVVVSMEVTKGQSDSLRAYLFMQRDPTGSEGPAVLEKTVMRRESPAQGGQPAMPARYAWTINTVTQDTRYWFEAGDDSTEDFPGHVRVVSRPRVTALRLTVHPPPYVDPPAPGVVLPAEQRTIDLIAGSTLDLNFKSSKALSRDAAESPTAWVSADTGDEFRAAPDAADSERLVVQLTPAQDQSCEIHLLDADGFENEPPETLTLVVHPDAAPTVAILEPVQVLEVTTQAAVRIVGLARDDLGINRIELSGEILQGGGISGPAGGGMRGEPRGRPFVREIRDWIRDEESGSAVAVRVDFDWALRELELDVGDRIDYTLAADDNRITEALSPQRGKTYAMRLVVVSEADFAAGVADELKRLADRLGLLLRRQEQLLTDTEQHAEMIQQAPDFDPDARLLRLSARQRRLAERVASVRKSAQSLADELIRNRISESSEKQQADMFADELKNLVEPDMHQAAAILNDARGESARLDQAAAVDQARAHEQAAIAAIRALLDQLTQWNDYRSMLANLRDLVDFQQQVSRKTAAAGGKTVGRDPDDLSDEARAELQRTAQSQDNITEAISRALAELHRLQAKLRSTEPDDARALADAERKLAGSESSKRSQAAADAIRENKTAQAQSDQNSIERALADAVSQLEAREQRKLAELSKKLGNLEDLVLRILEQQEDLHSATQKVAAEDADRDLPKLAGRQRNLARGTRDAVDTLALVPETGEAVQQVRRAAEAMSRATDGLYEFDRRQAMQAQDDAIEHLQLAVEVLAGLREKNEQAIKKAKLIAIKRELLDVRAAQAEINAESEQVMQRVHEAGRLSRIDVRRARKQAHAQEALMGKLSEVQSKLEDTPVYAWVVAKVLKAMELSRQMLSETRLEKPLTRAQERILSLLDQLVDAIKQAESMIEEQFAGGGGGAAGGGPAQMNKQKPVPTVAELIVLKGVQQDLVARTQALAEILDAGQPTEEQLEEASALGAEQHELKRLTQELTQKARQDHHAE